MDIRQRNIALDCIRALACLLVIVIHCPMPDIGTPGFIMASCTLIGTPCICLFFMVSGYLLLPTKETMFPFLKRRMKRVIWPTLSWTAFYLLVACLTEGSYAGQPWAKTILSIPLTRQGSGFLWFMYTLMGLYVLAPIISAWLNKCTKGELQFILALWGVSLLYPLLRPFLYITEDTFGILYYFTGYAGYFLLGYYVKRYTPNVSYLALAAIYLIPMMVALGGRLMGWDFLTDSFLYLSVWAAMMTFALFMAVLKILPPPTSGVQGAQNGGAQSRRSSSLTKLLVSMSNCSFGIYLVHRFVMLNGLFHVDFISRNGGIAQILMTIPLTLIISWAIVWLISHLPLAEYITGYTSRIR